MNWGWENSYSNMNDTIHYVGWEYKRLLTTCHLETSQ